MPMQPELHGGGEAGISPKSGMILSSYNEAPLPVPASGSTD